MADQNPTCLDAVESPSPAASDLRDQAVVLAQVLDLHPCPLTLAELVREMGGGTDDARERDRIERAVRDLVGAGLLRRLCGLVLPTRAALHFAAIHQS